MHGIHPQIPMAIVFPSKMVQFNTINTEWNSINQSVAFYVFQKTSYECYVVLQSYING